MDKVIVEVKFNEENPSECNYKHFDVILEDGKIETFHYHINNPMPLKEKMIGLTWKELCELCKKMFYEAIKY